MNLAPVSAVESGSARRPWPRPSALAARGIIAFDSRFRGKGSEPLRLDAGSSTLRQHDRHTPSGTSSGWPPIGWPGSGHRRFRRPPVNLTPPSGCKNLMVLPTANPVVLQGLGEWPAGPTRTALPLRRLPQTDSSSTPTSFHSGGLTNTRGTDGRSEGADFEFSWLCDQDSNLEPTG